MKSKRLDSRRAEAPVSPMFLDRWSPRSYKSGPLGERQIMCLFESSRWAPSRNNEQPWVFIYAVWEDDRKKFLSPLKKMYCEGKFLEENDA